MAMLPNPLPRLAELDLRLPAGTLVDTTFEGRWHEPLLWMADGPAADDAWASLLPARAAGLQPLLIEASAPYSKGPVDWQLMPDHASYAGDHDAEEVLAEFWAGLIEEDAEDVEEDDVLAPYGAAWPGLAPAAKAVDDPDDLAAEVTADMVGSGWLENPRAALVHARRSADIPAAIGWSGPLNYESDPARLCAVLRSWEDRFGIRVIALAFDRLTVSVAAPPSTQEEAEAVAAEHYAFCPDNIDQGTYETLREYAEKAVLDVHTWSFWWD
ncbi:DUF4253 domain-containing protein [Streptomyces sp. NPDC008079]|uniref:DUF4253 domain-containing protein n=1 Tax=Streptomyces sp. NPDC008079 TaxID=3364806 RepID=UPI0036E9F9AA